MEPSWTLAARGPHRPGPGGGSGKEEFGRGKKDFVRPPRPRGLVAFALLVLVLLLVLLPLLLLLLLLAVSVLWSCRAFPEL